MNMLFAGALALGFVIAPAAWGCDAPMPSDVKISPTAPTPEQVQWLGIWNGTFNNGLCTILAVKSIEKDGTVSLVVGERQQPRYGGAVGNQDRLGLRTAGLAAHEYISTAGTSGKRQSASGRSGH